MNLPHPIRTTRSARGVRRAVVAAVALAVLGTAVPAGAQRPPATTVPSPEAEDVARSMEELATINARLADLDVERERLSRDLVDAVENQRATAARAARLRTQLRSLDRSIERQQDEVAALRHILGQRAIAAYVAGGVEDEMVLIPGTSDDAMSRSGYLSSLNQSDDELAERIDASVAKLRRDRIRKRKDQKRAVAAAEKADQAKAAVIATFTKLDATIKDAERQSKEAEVRVMAAVARAEEARKKLEADLKAAEEAGRNMVGFTLDGNRTCVAERITVACSIAPDVVMMLKAAEDDGVTLTGGGWRDTALQIELRRQHCDGDIYIRPASACSPPTARPGSSQHEFGLAIDFNNCTTRSTDCYLWLADHAAEFGFKNLPTEPWHWSTTGN